MVTVEIKFDLQRYFHLFLFMSNRGVRCNSARLSFVTESVMSEYENLAVTFNFPEGNIYIDRIQP